MGQALLKLAEPLQLCSGSVADMLTGRRKRKRCMDTSSSGDDQSAGDMQSPKKMKLLTTTQYIYQALFKEQKNSDIAVMAMGKVWNLHKVYLCQSPYFYSMFNGSWKESCQDFVHIKILDDGITLEALDAVFGSMYSDEIEIDPKAVISILATATLFHLDGIIDKCAEVMIEHINAETAINYYEAACQYGCLNVKKSTFEWMEMNLLCIYNKHYKLLRQISVELMTALISSPDLYVMQTEFSLYTLLRNWIYLRMHPNFDPDNPEHLEEAAAAIEGTLIANNNNNSTSSNSNNNNNNGNSSHSLTAATPSDVVQGYFMQRNDKRSFLATPEGLPYVKPFQALRTQYLTNHFMDLDTVLKENIIPKDWLHNHVLSHWNSILKVDHLPEEGPRDLEPDVFYKHCMRCGRILLEPGYQKWRWTGFNFGMDLILIADSRVLSIRRHHRNEHERLLCLQTKRQFMIRVSITSINSQRQSTFTQKSDITSLCLEKNEEVTLMLMDTKLVHPLLISVNLLVVPPSNQNFKEHIHGSRDEANVPISEIGANGERDNNTTTTTNNNNNNNNNSSSNNNNNNNVDDDDVAVCNMLPSSLATTVSSPLSSSFLTTTTTGTQQSTSSLSSASSSSSQSSVYRAGSTFSTLSTASTMSNSAAAAASGLSMDLLL